MDRGDEGVSRSHAVRSRAASLPSNLGGTPSVRKIIERPKSKPGNRRVPLHIDAAQRLGRRNREMGYPQQGWVFPGIRDPTRPISPSTIITTFKRAVAATDYTHARPHTLRHIAATRDADRIRWRTTAATA